MPFEINERKLKSALPSEDSSPWYEGLKWLGAIVGVLVLFAGTIGLLLFTLFGPLL